jgi:hypothetical protein
LAQAFYVVDQRGIDATVNFAGRFGRTVANIDGWIDAYIVDGMVNGVATLVSSASGRVRKLQTGDSVLRHPLFSVFCVLRYWLLVCHVLIFAR